MSRSQIITDDIWSDDPAEWLSNPHAGDLLRSEFMDPLHMSAEQLAASVAVPVALVVEVIEGRRPMDGALDLRLGRYFGMSPGFFLGLQTDYELIEARRALNGELDRIMPRAA